MNKIMTTEQIKQAVIRFMDEELLIQIKFGGIDGGDVGPNGAMESWWRIHGELMDTLSESGLSHYDQYLIHKQLNAENWFCDPTMYEDPDSYDAQQDWIYNPKALDLVRKDYRRIKEEMKNVTDDDILKAIQKRQEEKDD